MAIFYMVMEDDVTFLWNTDINGCSKINTSLFASESQLCSAHVVNSP